LQWLGAIGLGLAATAMVNYAVARRTERRNLPKGQFLSFDGIRLHYIERGEGPPIVLLHGNGAMAHDFVLSGIVDQLATDHRVIAFDRPGFGFSERPRDQIWTATRQAALLARAIDALGARAATLVGHSWGTLVALAIALRDPAAVGSLVLMSGYYYPTTRGDVVLFSGPALPLLGDVMRYSISPLLGWLMAPGVYRKIFAPAPVPARFARNFPLGMALRPWQLRATAADTALMIPAAAELDSQYRRLTMPVTIVADPDDEIVAFDRQARRLAGALPHSTLCQIQHGGHMLHHTATQQIAAIIRGACPS
jgi:pimeloyl-ACP methyl ester carboxylesterase